MTSSPPFEPVRLGSWTLLRRPPGFLSGRAESFLERTAESVRLEHTAGLLEDFALGVRLLEEDMTRRWCRVLPVAFP
jgi:hypothetical protein